VISSWKVMQLWLCADDVGVGFFNKDVTDGA
jgi:hypothetical protein